MDAVGRDACRPKLGNFDRRETLQDVGEHVLGDHRTVPRGGFDTVNGVTSRKLQTILPDINNNCVFAEEICSEYWLSNFGNSESVFHLET